MRLEKMLAGFSMLVVGIVQKIHIKVEVFLYFYGQMLDFVKDIVCGHRSNDFIETKIMRMVQKNGSILVSPLAHPLSFQLKNAPLAHGLPGNAGSLPIAIGTVLNRIPACLRQAQAWQSACFHRRRNGSGLPGNANSKPAGAWSSRQRWFPSDSYRNRLEPGISLSLTGASMAIGLLSLRDKSSEEK
jgi:hypothetical protein